MPWSTPFDDPIDLRGGTRLRTLQEAADFIMKLPEAEQQEPRWQTAVNTAKGKKPKKRVEGQREMLLPISGKGGKDAAAKAAAPKEASKEASKKADKPVRAPARAKKAG